MAAAALAGVYAAGWDPATQTYVWLTTAGALGVLVVVFEGAQQLNQFHHNWVTYRGTCEALRHEKAGVVFERERHEGLVSLH